MEDWWVDFFDFVVVDQQQVCYGMVFGGVFLQIISGMVQDCIRLCISVVVLGCVCVLILGMMIWLICRLVMKCLIDLCDILLGYWVFMFSLRCFFMWIQVISLLIIFVWIVGVLVLWLRDRGSLRMNMLVWMCLVSSNVCLMDRIVLGSLLQMVRIWLSCCVLSVGEVVVCRWGMISILGGLMQCVFGNGFFGGKLCLLFGLL